MLQCVDFVPWPMMVIIIGKSSIAGELHTDMIRVHIITHVHMVLSSGVNPRVCCMRFQEQVHTIIIINTQTQEQKYSYMYDSIQLPLVRCPWAWLATEANVISKQSILKSVI